MKLGYVIAYVADVEASLAFYERAFGLTRRFLHEGGDYGELDTGATVLAFASHGLGEANLPGGYVAVDADPERAPGVEFALVTEDVAGAHDRAVAVGARSLRAPATKPWGQVVAWVRCPDGTLVELCTPMGA